MRISPLFLHAFCLLAADPAFAQKNILRNGGFEEHGEQKCLSCIQSSGQYAGLVYHWDNGGWHCMLCDQDYKQDSDDKKGRVCPMDKVSPQSGKAMISMIYSPAVNGISGGVEGASHLSARTTEPMRVGQLYEISLWLYVVSANRHDPDWGKHLGIALLPQNLSFFGGRNALIIPFIGVDTLVYDQWYQAQWRVRPLCTANYLMIGVFADPQWPKSRGYSELQYFLDNVSVVELPEAPAVADSSVYYCSRYDPAALGARPLMDAQMLFYENDAFALSAEHRAALDTFAGYANRYPDLVFELSGHTDSIGADNLALSQKRVQAVYEYLTGTLQLPAHRLIALARGSATPFRPNHTEEGRKMNRRTEIRQSDITLPMMYYRYALKALHENNKAGAFACLDKWVAKAEKGSLPLLLFDPRFDPLRPDKRWPLIEKKVRDSYQNHKYATASFLLDSIRLDACRLSGEALADMLNTLPGHIPGGDNYAIALPGATEEAVTKRYRAHYHSIRPVLEKTGWPAKQGLSESAVFAAYHLLLHSRDINALQQWLPALQRACEAGELPWIMYAKCYDQWRVGLGQPQRYLTAVGYSEDGNIVLPPWEGDENTVNEFRAKIGLPLLSPNVAAAMK